MKVRILAGALLAAPALLVATATSGHAGVEKGSVAFAGRITVVPGSPGSANVCFDAQAGCLDGVASGAVLAKPVTGMQGTIDYQESCTAVAPYAPVGTADLNLAFTSPTDSVAVGQVPALTRTTTDDVDARWVRAGLVAVILPRGGGEYVAGGAAVVAPAPHVGDVPLCGAPIDYVIKGAIAFA
jgi:hypothetical protein